MKLVRHSKYDETVVASINFLPDLNYLSLDWAREEIINGNYLEDQAAHREFDIDKNFKEDYYMSKGEFIFIIDRSGSMQGDRMRNAKKAL